ncbi:MAG: hypothetical protein J0G33_05795 [Afipia felis]|nr:hypothetical protein [Afipia felis]
MSRRLGVSPTFSNNRFPDRTRLLGNPRETLRLLDELEALGFTSEAFARLHHFRLAGREATIGRHRSYCNKTSTFAADGTNELVQRRLKLVLDSYQQGGFRSGHSAVFVALAEVAFHEIPSAAS